MRIAFLLFFILFSAGLVGCQTGANPTVVVQETAAPEATATSEPTATAPPTRTPMPTITEVPTMQSTNTPIATSTPSDNNPSEGSEGNADVPTPSPTNEVFQVFQNEPVVPHGPAGRWDGQYTDPGAAVVHNGTFHMLHNGFVGWPAPVGVAHSTSPDGYEWTRAQVEPVFVGDALEYVGLTALASSAIVEPDGTWVLYFYTWDSSSWPGPTKIGRATAPAPEGPWTADPEPVLVQGSAGEWDDYAIRAPSVVRTEEGYFMFYSGYTRQQGMIGMATSEDGIHWTKYNDPATTEAPFAESDPIFLPGPEGAWDAGHVFQPRVEWTPEGFVMLYSASTQINGGGARLGYAISQDGLNWQRSEGPILEANDVPGGRAIWFTELLYHDDTYFLFFELGTGGETEVYLATHEGSLSP